jgi:hypothetical protein
VNGPSLEIKDSYSFVLEKDNPEPESTILDQGLVLMEVTAQCSLLYSAMSFPEWATSVLSTAVLLLGLPSGNWGTMAWESYSKRCMCE